MTQTPPPASAPVPSGTPPLPTGTFSNLAADLPAVLDTVEEAVGIKPGWQTSEHWIVLAVIVLNAAACLVLLIKGDITSTQFGSMVGAGNAGLAAVYSFARSWLKGQVVQAQAQMKAPPKTT